MALTSLPQISSGDTKPKSFWSSKEGIIGIIIGSFLLAGVGYWVLPILTTIIWNTLNFMLAAGTIITIGIVLTSKSFRNVMNFIAKTASKKVAYALFRLDAFLVLEDAIVDMKKQRVKLYEQMIVVNSQKELLKGKIKDKSESYNHLLAKAQTIKNTPNINPLKLQNALRDLEITEKFVNDLTPMYNGLEKISTILDKVYDNSQYIIEGMESNLELSKAYYESVTKGRNAYKQALEIIKGGTDNTDEVDQTNEFLRIDIAGKLAEMKMANTDILKFNESIDIENATYAAEGLKKLEAYSERIEIFNTSYTYI